MTLGGRSNGQIRSMDDSPATEPSSELLTIACRFVPYDQWFITHVDASWKVAQVKSWLLAKCYNSFSSPRNVSNTTSTTASAPAPPIDAPERPRRRTGRRPASPIIFAPEPPNGSGRGALESDDDLEDDGHYYDEHGIYGAGEPDTVAKAGKVNDKPESVSKSGISNISYVSQISGLSYASTASKYSQQSHSSHLSQVSETSSRTRSPTSTEDMHTFGTTSIDHTTGEGKNNTDTVRPKRKRGPKGPRRPISPMTFAPMGKSPTAAPATKGGFGEYETYATYSPEDPAPNYALPFASPDTKERDGDIESIESTSTVPAYGSKFSHGDAYKRVLGLGDKNVVNSSDEEGTQFTMGYEEDGEDEYEEDNEYEEEPGQRDEKEDSQPPPGTGRVGPAPIVPNRPNTSLSTTSSPCNQVSSSTTLAMSNMGSLFSSRKEKDSKDKGKDKEKRKEKKKEKDKQKEKEKARSKLEKVDRGARIKDWVEDREKERELFTSSISAMSGISTKSRKDNRDRDREGRERKTHDGQMQKGTTPSYDTYNPSAVTVMRFSTGQILEDHFALGWYELKPYELLEIHRKGVILTLPRTITVEYISPYWEGSVRALRVVLRGPNNLAVASGATGSSARGKDIREIQENRLREQVERHGSVRDRERSSEQKDSRSDSRAHKRKESSTLSKDDGKDSRDSHSQTGSQSGQHHRPSHDYDPRRSRMVKLDWRERWVFIKDGILNVWKDREDATTAQYLPLSDLTDIRGADQLGRSLTISSAFNNSSTTATSRPSHSGQHQRGQSDVSGLRGMLGSSASASSQRIVCAKFKGKLRDGSHKASEVKEKRASANLDVTNLSAYAHAQTYPRTSVPTHQSTVVSTVSSAGGKNRVSSRPSSQGTVTSSKQPSSKPRQPASITSGSPPTSNPASLSSSPTLRPQISVPISLRMQTQDVNQQPRTTSIAQTVTQNEGYPHIKGKGKGRVRSEDGHESDDEAEGEVMSDGNMSGSGLLGRSAESPSPVTRPQGIRPLPSLPTSPAFPDHFDKGDSSRPDVNADTKDEQANDNQSIKLGVHPHFDPDLVDEDLSGLSSDGTLSSPVFAHSEDDSDVSNTRRGYGYGFNDRKRAVKMERDGEGRRLSLNRTTGGETNADGTDRGESDNAAAEADSSYVYVEGDHRPDTHERGKTTPRVQAPRPKSKTRTREKEGGGEWIVLDLRDDHAFKSFLRVLHRYAPHVLQSTFLAQLPYLTPPTQATPTSNAPGAYSAFCSSERKGDERLSRVLENPEMTESNAAVDNDSVAVSQSESMTNTPLTASTFQGSDTSHTLLSSPPASPNAQSLHHRHLPSLTIPNSDSNPHPALPRNQASQSSIARHGLNALLHQPPDAFGTFGVLPYPEWRTKLVLRAQRAGMGELNKAMEWFLFKGDQSHDLGITSSLHGFRAGNLIPERSPLDVEDSNDPELSAKRERRSKRERHMTIEQENIAIGISVDNLGSMANSPADEDSVRTAGKTIDAKIRSPDFESTDSGEESSDTEWLGWMADLHRQAKKMKDEELKRLQADEDGDEHLSDYNPQYDHRRFQEKQMALEPSAVVIVTLPIQGSQGANISRSISHTATSQYPSAPTPLENFGPPVLTSPSSNESLGRPRGRKQSFGFSTVDQSSSATTPSTAGRLERSNSRSRPQHQRQSSNSRTPNLLHFASTGYIGGSAREKESPFGSGTSTIRRPSMPTLSSTSQAQTLSSTTSTVASSPLNPNASFQQQQQASALSVATGAGSGPRPSLAPRPLMVPGSPGVGSGSSFGSVSSPRLPIGSTGSHTVPRRSSTAGLTLTSNPSVSSVSLGRSGSMLSKTPGLLRKKDGESEKAKRSEAKELKDKMKGKSKDKESKGKVKEDSLYADVSVDFRDSRKPRLSVSTVNSPYQPGHTEAQTATATSRAQSPQPTSPTASSSSFVSRQVRRVRSGSSLMSEGTTEWHRGIEPPKNNPPVKKKRGIMRGMTMRAEKLISGLESTLDFVDARQ